MIPLPPSLLPVIDLRQGYAVHAVAGNRAAYQRLRSRWCDSPGDVMQLLEMLRTELGLDEFYIADLDAIAGIGHHHPLIRQLVEQGYRIWLDSGLRSLHDLEAMQQLGVGYIILASETMKADAWHRLKDHPTCEKLVFSLDLYQGKLRSTAELLAHMEPMDIVNTVVSWGIRRIIVLDIANVGTSAGCSTLPLCQQIKALHPAVELITGGGIRSLADIEQLEQSGIQRVLVATWLHDVATTFALSPTA